MKQIDQCIILSIKKMHNHSYLVSGFAYENGMIQFFYYPSKKKNKFKIQLLMILNIEFKFHKEQYQIIDYSLAYPCEDFLFNITKYPIVYFLSSFFTEIFSNLNYQNKLLFKSMQNTVIQLDKEDNLKFIILEAFLYTAQYLGIDTLQEENNPHKINLSYFSNDLKRDINKDVYLLSNTDLNTLKEIKLGECEINKTERKSLTLKMLKYFQYHLEKFKASRLESLM